MAQGSCTKKSTESGIGETYEGSRVGESWGEGVSSLLKYGLNGTAPLFCSCFDPPTMQGQ
eukprot:2625677-Amphidinium_carterae.2